jgi:hypothetical protein
MKKMVLFGLLVAGSLVGAGHAFGQPAKLAGFTAAPAQLPISACTVNGVTYAIDGNLRIWGENYLGQPIVIGRIVFGGPTGYTAVRFDNVRFVAYCS